MAAVLAGVGIAQEVYRGDVGSAAEHLSPALAALIHQSREDAIERGVRKMPAEFRTAFEAFVPAEILDTVRWRVDGETGILGALLFQPGAVRAVTLDNVILFASDAEAANIKLWAHEISHVMQYQRWGIDGFAERFVTDHDAVEHEAREFRWSWMKATGRVPEIPTR